MAPKASFMKESQLSDYLDAVEKSLTKNLGPQESWPLEPAQMIAYFDDSLAVAIFKKVQLFKNQKISYKKAAGLFGTPTLLRNFLLNFASTGLKVANNTGWFKTSFAERLDFFEYLFKVLEHMVRSDIFVKDGKQIILSNEEVKKILLKSFTRLNENDKKTFKLFKVALFGLVWAFYFDTFYSNAFDLHGPYKIFDKKFGRNKTLVIYTYFNLCPTEIWKVSKEIPFGSVKIFCIYKDLNWRMSFWGQEDPKLDLNGALESVLIEIDGKVVKEPAILNEASKRIFKSVEKQTEYVQKLSSQEQVIKGEEISYYGLRNVLTYGSGDWKPPKPIGQVVEKFEDAFIKKYKDLDAQKRNTRRIFDPTNNYF